MKTLKYLMLLLAVAIALPAMAQKEEMEKAVKLDVTQMEKVKVTNVTEGKLSKNNAFRVTNEGNRLVAEVTSNKGTIHQMIKNLDGSVEKNCFADSAAYCQNGYIHMKKLPDLDVTHVLTEFNFVDTHTEFLQSDRVAAK
ncbi:MAG: hypothetical protein J5601_01985 [Elusimicrobiaceae bacterium]|nr:hypothetical protein [Elusimicrobiaceae bacterium]